ncbi:flavodoxin family protein [Clostridium sp.]|uniref:flavodoxin family protein n=1 Tax=Clostridium sp. TaxID=1506 RepID=UPI0026116B23|nr:flavodoxin family protein [Clostridium sp.]
MNIIAVNGSGRPFGNNYHVLSTCLDIFNKNNHTVELIQLCNLKIANCKSCYNCKTNDNQCIIEDDMTIISKKILESDLVILSSPIYMWQVSSQTKLFMERLYPFYHFDRPSDIKDKKLILVFTQASPDEKLFESYFEHIRNSMVFLGFNVVDMIVLSVLRNLNDYDKYPDKADKIKDKCQKYISKHLT